jgi:dodecin
MRFGVRVHCFARRIKAGASLPPAHPVDRGAFFGTRSPAGRFVLMSPPAAGGPDWLDARVATEPTEEHAMTVARVTEISATSTESFDDAVKQGIERAAKTLRGITSAWVKDQNVMIDNGKVSAFKVNLSVTFLLDD